MDTFSKTFLNDVGIFFESVEDLNDMLISRDVFLNKEKYDIVKNRMAELKKMYNSTFLTGLHECAETKQKWPLLNIVRQILNVYHVKMIPIRKSDGYTPQGVKKYKRYFRFLIIKPMAELAATN
jgi:predicted MPP superfamily phosphohydrolase